MATIISRLETIINKIDGIVPTDNKSEESQRDIQTHRVVFENKQDSPRITELPNEMSWNIDISSPMEILRILRCCDSQIFNGWHEFATIYDHIPSINLIIHHLQDILSDTIHNKVILSGCGTSGRLAFLISRSCNEYLIKNNYSPCFDYCLAGTDIALLTSQELPEDDPKMGVEDLLNLTKGAKKVLLIGITCGLSAPYVGGQIEYAMKQSNYITILMGFNPAHLSRNVAVEKWNDTTFRQICVQLSTSSSNNNNHILLNPILGPETITGSTRMKSGSATLILLQIIFIIAFYQLQLQIDKKISSEEMNDMIWNLLNEYQHIYRQTYSSKNMNELSLLCQLCANSLLTSNARVIYYGGSNISSILSFIDASEMKPTYGTPLQRYRSYFEGGWKYLHNKQGDLSHVDPRFQVEPKYLDYSSLTTHDSLIVIGNMKVDKLIASCAACKFGHISVGIESIESIESIELKDDETEIKLLKYDGNVCMKIDFVTKIREMIAINCSTSGLLSIFDDFCKMFATKLLLNAVSTAAHVLSGSVLHNKMINVRTSNDKLFYRAIGMIQEFGKVEFGIGRQCLLISIYGEDKYKEKENESISKHLIAARDSDKIVPVAILLASQISQQIKETKTRKELRHILDNEPSVRKALKDFCKY